MGKHIRIIPSWAAVSLAGLIAALVVGIVGPISHCAFGIGILAAFLMSKYYSRQVELWDMNQTIDAPDAAWLTQKQQAMETIIKKQAADLGRQINVIRIDTSRTGLTTIYARTSMRKQILVSAKAIYSLSDDELEFLICYAILCGRTPYKQVTNLVMTGMAFVFLLYMSMYIRTEQIGEFLRDAGIMVGLIALVWIFYGIGTRKVNEKREWALNAAMDYTSKPVAAAKAALLSSTFADIPEGIRLRLQEIRRMGFVPPNDGDLDWLQDR